MVRAPGNSTLLGQRGTARLTCGPSVSGRLNRLSHEAARQEREVPRIGHELVDVGRAAVDRDVQMLNIVHGLPRAPSSTLVDEDVEVLHRLGQLQQELGIARQVMRLLDIGARECVNRIA
jgi:hypothetical protein